MLRPTPCPARLELFHVNRNVVTKLGYRDRMQPSVTTSQTDQVTTITFDDGKVNALGIDALKQLHGALDLAEASASVVVVRGRPGILSAGFDMRTLSSGPQASVEMLRLGAELTYRIMSFPRPVIVACTGSAYPMGAFLLLAADTRIGVEGDFKIGLNEVAIGLTLPAFAIVLARHRLTRAAFEQSAVNAVMFTPDAAIGAGFLDQTVDHNALSDAIDSAAAAALALDRRAHAATKLKARADTLTALRHAIDDELTVENLAAETGR